MLINKGLSAGEVVTMKLSSGEEVISRLEEIKSDSYRVSKPLVVAMGAQGPGLMPFLFTVHPDAEMEINKNSVSVCVLSDAEFAKQYLQATTGITLA